ncbi:MAG: CRISPR-associated endonuclease Cas2 [Lachnospiraceae bacterium]|nr:CRISPR-associated endonuclease Cas2 [Lachnospiraceae bacterium]
MRILVLFDLPTVTGEDRKNYRKFRKGLLKNGFYMLQESVYCRMVLNQSIENSVREAVKKIKPPNGVVMMLSVTEKQFAKADFIVGNMRTDILDTDDRITIL